MALQPILQAAQTAHIFLWRNSVAESPQPSRSVCVDERDGSVWCGGEAGELYHISADGKTVRTVANTGGFILGVTLDSHGRLYLCDLHHRCIFVISETGQQLARLVGRDGDEQIQIPNFSILSADERLLYVSDTRRPGGPGIWRFDLTDLTAPGSLWMSEPCLSANGMALAPDGTGIYLVESHLPGVSYIPIQPDGSAGRKQLCIHLPQDEPDGLAFNSKGELFVGIYNPSRIYRFTPHTGQLDLVIEDATTDYLHHATNLAFRGDDELLVANLGAWHLTRIDLSSL